MERIQNFFFFLIGPLPHLPSRHCHSGKTLNNNNSSHLPAASRAALHRQLKAPGQIPPSAPTGSNARPALGTPCLPAAASAPQSFFVPQTQRGARGAGCTARENPSQGEEQWCAPRKLPVSVLPPTFWWEGEGEALSWYIFPRWHEMGTSVRWLRLAQEPRFIYFTPPLHRAGSQGWEFQPKQQHDLSSFGLENECKRCRGGSWLPTGTAPGRQDLPLPPETPKELHCPTQNPYTSTRGWHRNISAETNPFHFLGRDDKKQGSTIQPEIRWPLRCLNKCVSSLKIYSPWVRHELKLWHSKRWGPKQMLVVQPEENPPTALQQGSRLYFFPVLILLKTQLIFLLIEQFCVDSIEDLWWNLSSAQRAGH